MPPVAHTPLNGIHPHAFTDMAGVAAPGRGGGPLGTVFDPGSPGYRLGWPRGVRAGDDTRILSFAAHNVPHEPRLAL